MGYLMVKFDRNNLPIDKYLILIIYTQLCFKVNNNHLFSHNYIVSSIPMDWITITRKSGKHSRATDGNTGQLFRTYWLWLVDLASLVCDVDCWLSCRVSAQYSVVTGSISTEGNHGMHYWWDLIRLKQLSSVSVCRTPVFAGFSGRGNSIHNIIPQLRKKVHLFVCNINNLQTDLFNLYMRF